VLQLQERKLKQALQAIMKEKITDGEKMAEKVTFCILPIDVST